MKTNVWKTLLAVFVVILITPNVSLAGQDICSVNTAINPVDDEDNNTYNWNESTTYHAGTLVQALKNYNRGTECTDGIKINRSSVIVEDTLKIKGNTDSGTFSITGNSDAEDGMVNIRANFSNVTKPLFEIDNTANSNASTVEMTNLKITNTWTGGDGVAFIDCQGVDGLTLDNIVIANAPARALEFNNCPNLNIVKMTFQWTDYTSVLADEDAENDEDVDETEPYIWINNSQTVTIQNLVFEGGTDLDRNLVHINESDYVSLGTIVVEELLNPKATAIILQSSNNFLGATSLDIKRVAGGGVHFENVSAASTGIKVNVADLQNLSVDSFEGEVAEEEIEDDASEEETETPETSDEDPVDEFEFEGSETGFVLNNVKNIDVAITGWVAGFGEHGVHLKGQSSFVTISGGEIRYNKNYGVYLEGSSLSNTAVKSMATFENGDCGVQLESSQVVKDVEFINNGNSCALGVSTDLKLNNKDLILVATDYNEATLDMTRSSIQGQIASEIELHYYYALGVDAPASTGNGNGGGFGLGSRNGRFSDMFENKPNFGGGSNSATSSSDVTPVAAGNGTSVSQLTGTYLVGSLPYTNVTIKGSEYPFMAIVQTDSGQVLGVWYGDAYSIGEQDCLYYYNEADGGGCACIGGESATDRVRTYNPLADTDEDGLLDVEELSGACSIDGGGDDYTGTDPNDADSDDDGMSDGMEINSYIRNDETLNPSQPDTDGDGILDGAEDANGNGEYDAGEETNAFEIDTDGDGLDDKEESGTDGFDPLTDRSDPTMIDTDGDGLDDKEDEYPMCDQTTGQCQYSDCRLIDQLNEDYDASYSFSDIDLVTGGEDDDGDGISNLIEDSALTNPENTNCVFEFTLGETDPNNPDTDGDGCLDGDEDQNRNGVVDDGETDPRDPDSDDDGILDGIEQPGCVYSGNIAYTNPLDADTDGDGVIDGDEDLDFDGEVDAFETNPRLEDTDNDGLWDTKWPPEVVYNEETGMIEPAEEGFDLSPMYFDPTNKVITFYCGISSMDHVDTDNDYLPDAEEAPNCRIDVTDTDVSNPHLADTDGDLLRDDLEKCYGTSPNAPDTEGDGISDYDELTAYGSIPVSTLESLCEAGEPAYALGATDATTMTTCSFNKHATSRGSWSITLLMMLLVPLSILRMRKA